VWSNVVVDKVAIIVEGHSESADLLSGTVAYAHVDGHRVEIESRLEQFTVPIVGRVKSASIPKPETGVRSQQV